MGMSWSDLAAIMTILTAICAFGGVIIFAVLRTKFITIEECENSQTKCSVATCQKIDKLADQLGALRMEFTNYVIESEKRREAAKDTFTEQLSQIRVFMARIDQKILNDRWGSNIEEH